MQEVWKDVVGYEELFSVSNKGNFYSKRTHKNLKQFERPNGYMTIATKIGGRDGETKCFKVHREVANSFLLEPSEHQKQWADSSYYKRVYVNHIDGNKANNHVNNLEWCTGAENTAHYQEELGGKNKVKTKPDTAKLTDEQVIRVRELSKLKHSERKLAKIFGVSRSVIYNAKNGYSWVR